jgi:lysyl-tRNA synthetase class 2
MLSRQARNSPAVVKDQRLLAALQAGLPDCAGVAIGVDRLLLLLSNSASIENVLSFSLQRA